MRLSDGTEQKHVIIVILAIFRRHTLFSLSIAFFLLTFVKLNRARNQSWASVVRHDQLAVV